MTRGPKPLSAALQALVDRTEPLSLEELQHLPRGDRLAYVRVRKARTQNEFADEAGVDRSAYNQLERGNRGIGPDVAERIAKVSGGYPAIAFLGDDGRSEEAPLAEISRKLDEVLQRVDETSASYEGRLSRLEKRVDRIQKLTDRILKLNETSFAILLGERDESVQPPAETPAPPSVQGARSSRRRRRAS